MLRGILTLALALTISASCGSAQSNEAATQATLIIGQANEYAQQDFYQQYLGWVTEDRVPNFKFEAFDENWKGGEHPDEVYKHWGLYNADRTPK